ncbi:MAG: tRNA pseudouridine(55) synthase TruB [Pseudomonadota bacterium]|jgi:tRNA pseudouridine55 synthase|nr:tRNA pseudouridine(55) synthase TruB [Pseudomonadota bacterium]|tara:strand:- start:39 stop:905 length:867 start_codon:yes stop_codon:yes gene_type:complete
MDGFLILDKPTGITSAECVYKLRSVLGIKKIGHCGTLDPLATGLLPISIGEGTKFSNYLTDKDKLYEVVIKFGLETDTGDITGKIVSKSQKSYSLNSLETEVKRIEGFQDQLPPMYSALKVKGKPLYYWARRGVFLSREERKINVSEVTLIEHNNKEAKLRIACSKGTYIRGLVEDLGRRIKCYATVKSLRRLKVGHLHLDSNSCNLHDKKEEILSKINSCDSMLIDLKKIRINLEDAKKVRNGLSIDYNAQLKNKRLVRIYTETELFVGLGEILENKLFPKRLLATN